MVSFVGGDREDAPLCNVVSFTAEPLDLFWQESDSGMQWSFQLTIESSTGVEPIVSSGMRMDPDSGNSDLSGSGLMSILIQSQISDCNIC